MKYLQYIQQNRRCQNNYNIYKGNELSSLLSDGLLNLISIDSKILSSCSFLDVVIILKSLLFTSTLQTFVQCSLIVDCRGLTSGMDVRELTALCWSIRKERFLILEPIYSKLHLEHLN